MYSLKPNKKNTQTIRVNMLPSYLHLADEPILNMSQYDVGLYKYRICLYEKNSPYYISDWEDMKDDESDEQSDTEPSAENINEDANNGVDENSGESEDTNSGITDNNADSGRTDDSGETNSEESDISDGSSDSDNSDASSDSSDSDDPSEADDDEPITPTIKVYVQGLKPDNKAFRYEAEYVGNTVYLPEKEQITIVPGTVKCEVIIVKDNLRKTSEMFYINVEKSLIQDAYKISKTEVIKLEGEEEAEYIEPTEEGVDIGEISANESTDTAEP